MSMYHISCLVIALLALGAAPAAAQGEGSGAPASVLDGPPGAAVFAVPDTGEDAPSLLAVHPADRVLGDRDAPVTIFEFSSLTCPHCASFHADTLPAVQAELIDSGQANLVVRHFPLDRLALAAAMIVECMPAEHYFAFLDTLYASQASWTGSGDPLLAVRQLAMLGGIPQARIDACLQDEALVGGIMSVRLRAQTELEVRSTPTFFIGGEKLTGAQDLEAFAAAVAAAAEAAEAGGDPAAE